MLKPTVVILREIIKERLNLSAENIFIYNQNFKIPPTPDLFVVLQEVSSEFVANNSRFIDIPAGMQEDQYTLALETININVMSKNLEAQMRKNEVILALNSYTSQDLQSKNQFRIASIPNSFTNISTVEGEGMLNRFLIAVKCFAWYTLSNPDVPYYQEFSCENLFEN